MPREIRGDFIFGDFPVNLILFIGVLGFIVSDAVIWGELQPVKFPLNTLTLETVQLNNQIPSEKTRSLKHGTAGSA